MQSHNQRSALTVTNAVLLYLFGSNCVLMSKCVRDTNWHQWIDYLIQPKHDIKPQGAG